MGRSTKKRTKPGRPRLPEAPDIPRDQPPIKKTARDEGGEVVRRQRAERPSPREKQPKRDRDIPDPPIRHAGHMPEAGWTALMVTMAFLFLMGATAALILNKLSENIYVSIVMGVVAILYAIVHRRGRR